MIVPGIRLFLHGLQSPINIGSILRVAETFAVPVEIWDEHGVFADAAKTRVISDFSCGAYTRGAYLLLAAPPAPGQPGPRHVATCLRDTARPLPGFVFEPQDLVAIGNEYDGLPPDYIDAAPAWLRIPMPATFTPKTASFDPIDPEHQVADPADGSPVLSAAMSAGIICYQAFAARLAGPTRP